MHQTKGQNSSVVQVSVPLSEARANDLAWISGGRSVESDPESYGKTRSHAIQRIERLLHPIRILTCRSDHTPGQVLDGISFSLARGLKEPVPTVRER